MKYVSKLLRFLLILVFCCALTACFFSGSPKTDEEGEAPADDSELALDLPQYALINKAQKFYSSGLFTEAKEAFELLRDGYPFGPYAEFAQLKIADALFESGEYETAALTYKEFISQYPGHEAVPYAIMKAARSHQLAAKGVGKDAGPLIESIKTYDELIKEHPHCMFAETASVYREEAVKDLISSEMRIVNYYKKIGNEKAYKARLRRIKEKWSGQADTEGTNQTDSKNALEPASGTAERKLSDSRAPGSPAA